MALQAIIMNDGNTYDVIIIGGGPAAFSAAIFLRNGNYKVGYIEKNIPGGKLVNINNIENIDKCRLDCSCSRTLTNNGVYTCPVLTSDERGRSGSSFEDYSKRNFLETEICSQCAKNGKNLFLNSWM